MPDGGQSRPDWRVPAIRCGLEVTLVALITAYLWVNVNSPVVSGLFAVAGLTGAVVVLFYYVDQQSLAWVRYASKKGKRKQRRRERRERQRAKQIQEQQQGNQSRQSGQQERQSG